MANIYVNSAVPAWETFFTHVSFYATAAVLGCFIYAVFLWHDPDQQEHPTVSTALVAGAGAGGLQLVCWTLYLLSMATGSPAAEQSLRFLASAWPLLAASQLLVLGGLAVTLRFWQAYRQGQAGAAGNLLYGSLSALVGAALIGRYLFYACGALPLGSL